MNAYKMCKFVYYDGENTIIKLGNACIKQLFVE